MQSKKGFSWALCACHFGAFGQRIVALDQGREPLAYYAARLVSANKRSLLAHDQPQGLSPSGTINAVLILR
jgi:hypothetical protein